MPSGQDEVSPSGKGRSNANGRVGFVERGRRIIHSGYDRCEANERYLQSGNRPMQKLHGVTPPSCPQNTRFGIACQLAVLAVLTLAGCSWSERAE